MSTATTPKAARKPRRRPSPGAELVRTNVHLAVADLEDLRWHADALRRPVASLVRDAVLAWLREHRSAA